MNKDVIITIKGEQFDSFIDEDAVELITEGELIKNELGYNIVYNESPMTGRDGKTTLSLEKSRLTMTRDGEMISQMVFEQGHKKLCHYDTGYGVFELGISTKRFDSDFSDNGGEVTLDYILEVNNAVSIENKLHISVREAIISNDKSGTIS